MQKIYNISVPKKYLRNGVEKTMWNNVGKLIKFEASENKPEGYRLELFMFPETKFGVFEQKTLEQKNERNTLSPEVQFYGNGEVTGDFPKKKEEIKVEEIPFKKDLK